MACMAANANASNPFTGIIGIPKDEQIPCETASYP